MKSIRVTTRGGSEVLTYQDEPKPDCSPERVLLKVIDSGINFADIMQHQGTYPLQLPLEVLLTKSDLFSLYHKYL